MFSPSTPVAQAIDVVSVQINVDARGCTMRIVLSRMRRVAGRPQRNGLRHTAPRPTLTEVLRQSDRASEALTVFREGEQRQAVITPHASTRSSRRGCHDGDLLLAEAAEGG